MEIPQVNLKRIEKASLIYGAIVRFGKIVYS